MRVAHTVSSLKGGGMEHFVLRLAEAQVRRGDQAAIVSLTGGPLLAQAERAGLRVHVLEGNKIERVVRAALVMARLRPDIVHAHNPTSLHYASIGKLVTRARLVVTDHAQTRGVVRVPSALEWRLADAVVAVSKKTADESVAIGAPQPVKVIHNGIDPKAPTRSRADVRAELGLGDDRIVVVQTAGFVKVKAHDVMLRALARLGADANLTALLVGDGELRHAMESLARQLGLDETRVRFLGFRADVPDLLGAADVFALPSRSEGLPLSVLEAMAQGLAVVATPVGGVPELIDEGVDGLLVKVDDNEALGAALARLAGDPALRARIGAAARARVARDFSFETMTDRYDALYRSLLR